MRRRSGRSRRSARTGAIEVFIRPENTLVVRALGLMVRLRAEIAATLIVVLIWYRITHLMPGWVVVVLVAGGTLIVFGVPVSRRYALAHLWCTITRHRLRACLVQVRAMNHDGAIPLFFWVRPTPVGERVRLIMRPGVCISDIDGRAEHIAAACWATEARVRRSRRFAAVVTVDVVRRNPLAPKHTIGSPLSRIPLFGGAPARQAGPPSPLSAVPTGPAAPVPPTPSANGSPKRPVSAAAPAKPDRPAGPVTTSGEDVSDYV